MIRVETFERIRPDGEVVVIERDLDTGEQTTVLRADVEPDGAEGEYAAFKVADLRAEIVRRNSERADESEWIPTEGKKAELVAFLAADDAVTE
ncbi:MAG: hypothetical protein ACOH10_11345 [Rhodoglobus sp.]